MIYGLDKQDDMVLLLKCSLHFLVIVTTTRSALLSHATNVVLIFKVFRCLSMPQEGLSESQHYPMQL